MDKTVWSDGKNITIEIISDSRINFTIYSRNYHRGTYSFKLADDEDLIVGVSCNIPRRKLVREGDVRYFEVYSMNAVIRSSDGREISNYLSIKNDFIKDMYISEHCIVPFTEFKNGDKLIIEAKITSHLKEI